MEPGEFQQWIENCWPECREIGNKVSLSIDRDKYNQYLFSVRDSELINHRFGYCCGSKIIDLAVEDYEIKDLFHFKYQDYHDCIKDYFELI
ncbi:MAG: hypothetical protein ACOCZZ_02045 [Bacillota bacterium]